MAHLHDRACKSHDSLVSYSRGFGLVDVFVIFEVDEKARKILQLLRCLESDAMLDELCRVGGSRHGIGMACVVDCAHQAASAKDDEEVVANQFCGLNFGIDEFVRFLGPNFDCGDAVFACSVCLDDGGCFVSVRVFVNYFFIIGALSGDD